MRILGIDVGINGAAAVYDPAASVASGLRWQIEDIPTTGDGTKRRVNAVALMAWIQRFTPDHAFIELVNVMPKQGIASSGRFMRTAGAIEAVVACCGIPTTFVVPVKWKPVFGLKGADKEASRQRTIQLHPELGETLSRKLDHNRAEACLLAVYGSKLYP